jgi:hypothetical protein
MSLQGTLTERERLSTVDLHIKVACSVKNVISIFILKSIFLKLLSARRSTVLFLPLQLGFPGLCQALAVCF